MPPDRWMPEPGAAGWWDEVLAGEPWVLPDLADFWFCHRAGLALVREFLSRLALDQVGDGLVGCSGWCWAFWTRYWPGLPVVPLTPAPLTGERLTRWLSFLSCDANGRAVTARMSHDGLYVLPAEADLHTGHVLHALLLHNGLSPDELAVVTGLSAQEVRLALAPLVRAGLAAPDEGSGCYRVRPLGYPAVRRYLQARGYLLDAF